MSTARTVRHKFSELGGCQSGHGFSLDILVEYIFLHLDVFSLPTIEAATILFSRVLGQKQPGAAAGASKET